MKQWIEVNRPGGNPAQRFEGATEMRVDTNGQLTVFDPIRTHAIFASGSWTWAKFVEGSGS